MDVVGLSRNCQPSASVVEVPPLDGKTLVPPPTLSLVEMDARLLPPVEHVRSVGRIAPHDARTWVNVTTVVK